MMESKRFFRGTLLVLGIAPLSQAIAQANSSKLNQSSGLLDNTKPSIEEVIVTGQKFNRNLQDTVTSASVTTELRIQEENLLTFNDVIAATPNVHSGERSGTFRIRGINSTGVTTGSNTPSGLASVYVDGANLPANLISAGAFSTWDVQQVEILRGPQSTLQGRNTLAGAVVMTSKRPEHQWGLNYRAQYGDYGREEIAIATGGGITDELAVRFSGEHLKYDGYSDNITRNETADFREDDNYRFKALYEPSAVEGLSIMLSHTDNSNRRGKLVTDRPPEGTNLFDYRVTSNNDVQENFYDFSMTALNVNYDINQHWALSSVSTFSDYDNGYIWDADDGPEALAGVRQWDQNTQTTSQELRLTFDYEKISGVMGAYYFNEAVGDDFRGDAIYTLESQGITSSTVAGILSQSPLASAPGADALIPELSNLIIAEFDEFDPIQTASDAQTQTDIKSFAFFTDFTYRLNDRIDILAGLRYDNETQENGNSASITLLNGDAIPDPANLKLTNLLPNFIPEPLVPTVAGAAGLVVQGINDRVDAYIAGANQSVPLSDTQNETLLPKLGASYHFNDDMTTSFLVQKAYRSGGVGINAARGESFQYDPEFTWNYELSFRSVWLEGDLVANANVFYTDWEAQQVRVYLSPRAVDREIQNAGRSEVKGFELELTYQATDYLSVYGGLGNAQTTFTEFDVEIPNEETGELEKTDLSGRPFAGAPEWTANIGARLAFSSGWLATVNANYADTTKQYTNIDLVPNTVRNAHGTDPESDSRVLVNGQIGYEWDNIGVYLVGRNLLGEEYIASIANRGNTLGAPRQLGLSVRGHF